MAELFLKALKENPLSAPNILLNEEYDDDHVRMSCTDWSSKITKEKNWVDSFNIGSYSKEILKWINNGYN